MKVCTRCILDETDPTLTFDDQGVCSSCHDFDRNIKPRWHPGTPTSLQELDTLVAHVKASQKNKPYDAIIGLSGGVDSSYLAYWAAKEAGLRLLAVHVDAGWNSDKAVQNIEKIVKHLGIELYTHVVDWRAIRDVQRAFFKAGVPNQDIPQDHAFFSALYGFAVKNNIRYVLNGSNYATESILPAAWGYDAMDSTHIRDICKKFSAPHVNLFPFVSFFKYYVYYPRIKKMTVLRPLNFLDYRKEHAIQTLSQELGWQYYGTKHGESRFTKFFQNYWLPTKFGFDKRKAHLSSLILAEQMTREEALKEVKKPLYTSEEAEEDLKFVAKKLEMEPKEFKRLMQEPNRKHEDFKNHAPLLNMMRCLHSVITLPRRLRRGA